MKEETIHPAEPQLDKTSNTRILLLLSFLVPALLYMQSLRFDFTHFDDTQLISNNISYLSDISNVPDAFLKGAFVLQNSSFYRPLQTVSYMLDIQISGGNNTWMYHLGNILLIGLISLTLSSLLRAFSLPPKLSLLSVLFFAVHPLFVSTVAWIPSRGDLLLALFSLLSFYLLIKYFENKRPVYAVFHWLTFTLALFSKETAVFLPALFAFYYFIFVHQNRIERIIVPGVLLYAVSGTAWFLLRSKAIGEIDYQNGIFGIEAFLLNLKTIPEGIAKFFLPFKIAPIPGYTSFYTVIGLLLIAGIIILLVKNPGERPRKEKLFALIWFLVLLIPTMLFKHLRIDYLDHRFLLPLTGILLFLLFSLPPNWFSEGEIKMHGLIIAVIIGLGIYTFNLMRAYEDKVKFYNAAIAKNEESAFAYNNRGYLKMRDGLYKDALSDYNRAIALSPDYYKAFSDRGWVKSNLKDAPGAIRDLNKAISINENHNVSYYRRGVVYLNAGDNQQAIKDFTTLVEIDPDNSQGFNYRGLAFLREGEFEKAIEDFDRAIRLDPRYAEAYGYRTVAKYSLGDLAGALRDSEQVLTLNPGDTKMRGIRATILQEISAQ